MNTRKRKELPVAILPQPSLLDWSDIEASSDLDRLRLVLRHLPDEPLMEALEAERGRGRDDYPVRAVWNALLAGVVYQHASSASLLRELRRNAELRWVCGFDLSRGGAAVPTPWALSRFMLRVERHGALVEAMFHALVERLKAVLPELGRLLGVDGKALLSFGKPRGKGRDRRTEREADWGAKTVRREGADGQVREKQTFWFGFKLHLLVDTQYELPLGYEVTRASVADTLRLRPLLAELARRHPGLVARAEELTADKGYDSAGNCAEPWDKYRIRPVIDKTSDWQVEPGEPRGLVERGYDTVVYDVRGQVFCVCPQTGEQRPMAFWGFERERGCLKYRCPLASRGQECAGRRSCPGAESAYGKVVRIPLARDRRLFVPIPRDTPGWVRSYARRSAVERVNSRVDRVLGFEQHTVRGLAKMRVKVGIGLSVLLAMALGRVVEGDPERMRSLLAPVRQAAA